MPDTIAADLARLIGDAKVLAGPAAERAYDCDGYTVDRGKPTAVVLPESTEEVAAVVRWCNERDVPFTPRGAGTGISGGVLAALGGVVISTKRLTKILDIDVENRLMRAQAGVPNRRLSDAVKQYGLHFAPDPSSQSVSTLGGNIAENSGGPHTLKYGVTTQHVLAVTMVDPFGEILELGSRTPGAPGLDLVGLVIGSEGTLGVVTEAWVKLTPLPTAVATATIAFSAVRDATQTVADIIATGTIPAALEIMDRGILGALKAAFGLQFPDATAALMLVECDTNAPSGAADVVMREMDVAIDVGRRNHAIEIVIAKDEVERAKLWTARKKGIGAIGRLAPSIVTHDGVIPRSKLPEMLDFVYATAAKYNVGVANLFHAGDGNLHPCFYFDDRDADQVSRVVEAGEDIIRRCVEMGGSVSGEHGIGIEKVDMMPLMFSESDLALQATAKRIFNDRGLCNPCKILPNQKSCVEHKMRWRGIST